MDIGDQRGGRCKYDNQKEQSLIPFKEQEVLDMIAERDTAIEERNQALLERKKAFEERQVAIAQRNLAIKERNDAVLERNTAFSTLQQSMLEPVCSVAHHQTKRLGCCPGNHGQASSGYLQSEREIFDALYDETLVVSESSCPTVSSRKRKCIGVAKNKKQASDHLKLKNEWNSQNLGLNKIDFDESLMPFPGCSCTGIFRQCHKWGNGGWQSCCCTNTISVFPLPLTPKKPHVRVAGRKMSGSVFSKLLSQLAMEGYDFSRPVDLKKHWSRHGTNRYITIK